MRLSTTAPSGHAAEPRRQPGAALCRRGSAALCRLPAAGLCRRASAAALCCRRSGLRKRQPACRQRPRVFAGPCSVHGGWGGGARDNFAVYGYYGVSVFAEVNGMVLDTIASQKLVRHERLAVFTAGDLLGAGLELWDTGQSPHYDVVHEDKAQLVALMVGCPHRLVRNAHYEPPEGGA